VGSYTQYCLLENSTNPAACIWLSGPLPSTYSDSSPDGSFSLTGFLKNNFGVSIGVTSNTITLDRTAPILASAVIGNANPTNNPVYSLSYGAVTGTYSDYCLLENNTAPGSCVWVTGTLPSTYTVSAPNATKAISIWLRDAAGNVSNRVTTAGVFYDSSVPTVSFNTPAAGAYANISNFAAFTVDGFCSVNGQTVTISGAASASPVCAGGTWTTTLNLTAVSEGAFVLRADLTNGAGTAASQASRSFVKDSVAPTVAILLPSGGSYVNIANVASFSVSGTCSENTRNVVISGSAAATVACAAGNWSANLDFTAAAAGAVTININHSDAAGNAATPASRSFTKDVTAPTLAITAPAGGTVINSGNVAAFTVSGTCSENGRNVVLSGAISTTAPCGGGIWSSTFDYNSVSDGPVVLYADHTDLAGNPAPQQTRSFTKATGIPAVAVTAPAAGSFVNSGNVSAFAVNGTCSQNGQNVVITGDATSTVACAGGVWNTTLNFTAAADGTVTINVNHNDGLGNNAVQFTRTFTKDVGIPTVAVSNPAAGSYVNIANVSAFAVTGTCSENTRNVVISGDAVSTVTCSAGAWNATLNFSAAADGTVNIAVNHNDAAGNTAVTATRSFTKDVGAPAVVINSPATNSYVTNATKAAFPISGTCSENGRNVVISGAGSATVACAGLVWSTTVDVSAAADGTITLNANHTDLAGNPATQDSRNFIKDVALPTVAISTPAALTYVNAANAASFAVTGTCSEDTRNVVITGSASLTTVCTSGSWSANLDFTAAADGTVTINVNHSDLAGNPATPASRNFIKDVTPPTLASMTISNSSPTTNTVYSLTYGAQAGTFAQYCILENSTTFAACSGVWVTQSTLPASFTVSGTENAKALTIWLKDTAGNVSTLVTSSNSVTLDTTLPTVTLTSFTGGQAFIGGTSKAITWTATDTNIATTPIATYYSTDSGSTWNLIAASLANSGTYSWTLPSIDSNTVRVKVTAIDAAGNVGFAVSASDIAIDTTPPVFTAAAMSINSGTTPIATNHVPVAFTVTDTAAKVTQYCLKYNTTTTPTAGDACWVSITPTVSYSANVNFQLGFSSGAYSIYAWAKNAAGLISTLTNAGAGTLAQDKGTITFTPVLPPTMTGVTASSADGSVNLTIASGSSVYIKWNASSSGSLTANPISIFYTTDDINYTAVPGASALTNTTSAGCTITGSETGCFKWTNGSPTNTYYRIRVGGIDTNGRQAFQSSQALNIGSTMNILAGTSDPGTGGDALAGSFYTQNLNGNYPSIQYFVVSSAGIIYFIDTSRGLLKIDPADGIVKVVIKTTGVSTDGAVPATATLRDPYRIAFDSQERVLLFDYNKIRRYDPVAATLTTIIGGGAQTTDGVTPLNVAMSNGYSGMGTYYLIGTPDGKIYFQSENYYNVIVAQTRLRVYDPGTGLVTSITPSGNLSSYNSTQDITLCGAQGMSAIYDPVTGAINQFLLYTYFGAATTGCIGNGIFPWSSLSPTGVATGPQPTAVSYSASQVTGADGNVYLVRRIDAVISKYNTTTHIFDTVVGTGTKGACADGTPALSCKIDPVDVYATRTGQVYFNDRGKIRTLDQAGNVYTVAGSGATFGDGGPAIYAKIGYVNDVRIWNDGTNDRIVLVDSLDPRIREFTIGSTISTLAGNGNGGAPNTASAANTQTINVSSSGTAVNLFLQVHPTTGDVYFANHPKIQILTRSTGKWVDLIGGGATNFKSADGLFGTSVFFNGWSPLVLGFDGVNTILASAMYGSPPKNFLKLYTGLTAASSVQSSLVGNDTAAGPLAVDGTLGTASTVQYDYNQVPASWDAFSSRWVITDLPTSNTFRTIAAGGTLGTLTTTSIATRSFAYRHDATHDILYFCDTNSVMRKKVIGGAETTLTWPVPGIKCNGHGMLYSPSRNSLIFPYLQNGLSGVAEYLNP
jgi:heat shock protein HslJ